MGRPPSGNRRRFLSGFGSFLGLAAAPGCVSPQEAIPVGQGVTEEEVLAFQEVSSERGIEYEYVQGKYRSRRSSVSNAGVYVTDVSNDGRDDVLAIGNEQPVLFESTGDGFRRSNRLPRIDGSIDGALFFDSDNDGYEDLLVLRIEETPVFLEHTGEEYAIVEKGFDRTLENPVVASAADSTGDGTLDVFIGQNGNWDERLPVGTSERSVGEDDNGNPNLLYRNEGDAFRLATDAGIEGERWTLAVSFVDFTGDGSPDIHVGNDYNYDKFYRNEGDGTFTWTELPDSHRNAMSSTVADITGNHKLDIFVTNIKFPRDVLRIVPPMMTAGAGNNLFVNRGDGDFVDEAGAFRVTDGGWGWAAVVQDFNNDMRKDIFQTTQHLQAENHMRRAYGYSPEEIYKKYPSVIYPQFFERTDESEYTTRTASKLGFEQMDGRGAAALDIDNNGAIDLVVADASGPYKLYENVGTQHNWLRVRVRGSNANTAIGAKLYLTTQETTQFGVVHSNSDFLAQGPRWKQFGLGTNRRATLEVTWPAGPEHEFQLDEVNRSVEVHPDGSIE